MGVQCDQCAAAPQRASLNRDAAAVQWGTSNKKVLYCGRQLGCDAIPGSDGHCGPDNGEQRTERLKCDHRVCPHCPYPQYGVVIIVHILTVVL